MNDIDHSLDRLLRSAARARSLPEELPYGFTTRVVSSWLGATRERICAEALWFRRAFLCALALMTLSVGWSYKTDTAAQNDEVAIASYDASSDLP